MIKLLSKYWCEDDGATAIEYGLIVAGIAIAIAVTIGLIGGELNTTFTSIQTYI
tara:strand:- start:50705 stop:50866 length:162 start_codon:yes stop_codon:yes gene_type:complete